MVHGYVMDEFGLQLSSIEVILKVYRPAMALHHAFDGNANSR